MRAMRTTNAIMVPLANKEQVSAYDKAAQKEAYQAHKSFIFFLYSLFLILFLLFPNMPRTHIIGMKKRDGGGDEGDGPTPTGSDGRQGTVFMQAAFERLGRIRNHHHRPPPPPPSSITTTTTTKTKLNNTQ